MTVFRNTFRFAICFVLVGWSLYFSSCTSIDLYEKTVPIPAHQWQTGFKPAFKFNIKDTASPYQLYVIIRHNNGYKYNNIWVNLYAQGPSDSARKFALELPLANKEGWLGSGMDDIFEHRIAFALDPQKFRFTKRGDYTF
ncbi:MAG TPA: gliding motility lipoprotein GldH, partial [Flavisolibacter sp.]|nr:gliding motility lipoprotein GldH [Flavisolibacter sp.]